MNLLVDSSPNDALRVAKRVYSRLFCYEQLKEATTLLELALWKSKIDEKSSDENDTNTVINRDQYRICCGADIVVQHVLLYLGVSGVDEIYWSDWDVRIPLGDKASFSEVWEVSGYHY